MYWWLAAVEPRQGPQELRNLLDVAEVVSSVCLERTESRGSHYRRFSGARGCCLATVHNGPPLERQDRVGQHRHRPGMEIPRRRHGRHPLGVSALVSLPTQANEFRRTLDEANAFPRVGAAGCCAGRFINFTASAASTLLARC